VRGPSPHLSCSKPQPSRPVKVALAEPRAVIASGGRWRIRIASTSYACPPIPLQAARCDLLDRLVLAFQERTVGALKVS